uniref:hypothetical protein n=1 Tax=Algoriphagus sp. TaxID=1872435 RepID=UPI004047CBA2
GVAYPDNWLFAGEKVVRKPLIFHPGTVDESIFAGSAVPFLAAEFFLGHTSNGFKELAKKLPKILKNGSDK